jgi:hypothetical protein
VGVGVGGGVSARSWRFSEMPNTASPHLPQFSVTASQLHKYFIPNLTVGPWDAKDTVSLSSTKLTISHQTFSAHHGFRTIRQFKGTVLRDFNSVFWHIWICLRMNINRFGFWHFFKAPRILLQRWDFWCG